MPIISKKACKNLIASSKLPASNKLGYLNGLLKFGGWMRNQKSPKISFKQRHELYEYINFEKLNNRSIDYLEFGVYTGTSIKIWSEINDDPDSRFFGFDTFEGLPEDWKGFTTKAQKGAYNANGKLPEINDNRVTFIKGLFQDTLVNFLDKYKPANQVVVHCDADLYSSTLYILTILDRIIRPGTIIIFDEFCDPLGEFQAFLDYISAYKRRNSLIAFAEIHDNPSAIEILT